MSKRKKLLVDEEQALESLEETEAGPQEASKAQNNK